MAKVLTVGCDLKRLSEINGALRAHGHYVRGADCRSTMRHLLALEPFQFVAILDPLPATFSDALRTELNAGQLSPCLLRAEGMNADDVVELLTPDSPRTARAA
ncbi:MAG TPA: hypothetical protein VG897_08885 [Terriglobales bacterium]|nr:hypothetical protein [Terriglobales bacterium]